MTMSEHIMDEETIGSPGPRDCISEEEQEPLAKFIEQYELSPELWNPTHPMYMKKTIRNSALDRLLPYLVKVNSKFDKREDVKKKINSLRTNYRKELKKIAASKRSGRSTDEIYIPSSWVFHALSFLKKFEKPVQQQTTEPAEVFEHEQDSIQSQELDIHPEETSASFIASTSSMLPPPALSPISRYKKPKTQGPISKQNELLHKACSLLESSSKPTSEIPTIAKAWGEKLLTLESTQRSFAEKAINDILFEAILGTLYRGSIKINIENVFENATSDSSNQSSNDNSNSSLSTYNYEDYNSLTTYFHTYK